MASNFVVSSSPCPSKLRGWLCSFAGCALCENQILSEDEALKMGCDHKIMSVDQATKDSRGLSQMVHESWTYINEHLPMGLYHLKSLPRKQILDNLHSSFPDMLSVGDLEDIQCRNYDVAAIRQHYGLQYRWLLKDMFNNSIQPALRILEERASDHPSKFVSTDSHYLQLGWDLNLFKLSSADCCVSLKEDDFGTAVATDIDTLHKEGVYTSTRGGLILAAQVRTYTGLAALVRNVLNLGRVLNNFDVDSSPTTTSTAMFGAPSLVSSMREASSDLDHLLNSLQQALLPKDPTGCCTIVSSIERARPRYGRLGLSSKDSTSSALSDLLWHKPITLLCLSQLRKDLKTFLSSCPSEGAGNTATASAQAAFHAMERDLETLTAVIARELSLRYIGGIEAGIFGDTGQSVPDAIPLCVDLRLLSENRLAWLVLHVSDSTWPLQDRTKQLLSHIDAGSEYSDHFTDDISHRLSILRLVARCCGVLERMQPCSPIRSGAECNSRGYGSVSICLRATDTWTIRDHEQQQLLYMWGECVYSSHQDRMRKMQALVARSIVYLERCWHDRTPANLSLTDMWGALGIDSYWKQQLLNQGSMQLRALSELEASRIKTLEAQRRTTETPDVANPDQDTDIGVGIALDAPASSPATSASKSENTAAPVAPLVYGPDRGSVSSMTQRDSTMVAVLMMPKPKAPRPDSNQGPVDPFKPRRDSTKPRPVQGRDSPQAISSNPSNDEASLVGLSPSASTTPRPSQFEEDVSQTRTEPKKKTRPPRQADVEDQEEAESDPPTPAPEDRKEQLVFKDPLLYDLWCEVFPPPGDRNRLGRELSFVDLRKVMSAEPLLFAEVKIEMPGVKFVRPKIGDAEAQSFTLHLPHQRAPVFDKQLLDSLKVRLRHKFGWQAEDFILAEE